MFFNSNNVPLLYGVSSLLPTLMKIPKFTFDGTLTDSVKTVMPDESLVVWYVEGTPLTILPLAEGTPVWMEAWIIC